MYFSIFIVVILLGKVTSFVAPKLVYSERDDAQKLLKANQKCDFGFGGKDCSIECGKSFVPDKTLQIVGGNEAPKHKYNSIAYLTVRYKFTYLKNNFYLSFQCAGSLIDKSTVLTAGHCVEKTTSYQSGKTTFKGIIDSATIVLGQHNLTETTQGSIYPVKEIIRNANYDTKNSLNDIALLKLVSEVVLNEFIQIACLPRSILPVNSMPTAVGWGLTSVSGSISDVLREVAITVYDGSFCKFTTSSIKNWGSQICAGDLSGKKDTCQGDSGGPLLSKMSNGIITRYFVVGITSYGIGCATPNIPAVYTRVSFFHDWILANL